MRISILILLFILVGCASKKPERKVASEDTIIRLGNVDLKKSLVQIFPAVSADNGLWYYFYLQLKDSNGKYVDCDEDDIALKTNKGKKLKFKFERLLSGRYYITLEKTAEISSTQLDFFIQKKPLKEQFKLHLRMPDKEHTKIKLVKKLRGKFVFQLRLADKQNQPVELPDRPEILIEGQTFIEDIKHIHEGVWEFSVIYPEENQIMYFSVRAMGVLLTNIYRYQHVEKYRP